MTLDALDPTLSIHPSRLQVDQFLHLGLKGGFSFINLHEYHETAKYPPSYSSDKTFTQVGGREAYHRYLDRVKADLLPQVPGAQIVVAPCEMVMTGAGTWHEIVIGYYPTREAAIRLGALPGYEKLVIHRTAGLKAVLTLMVDGRISDLYPTER